MCSSLRRRQMLQGTGALTLGALPLLWFSQPARAQSNPDLRAKLNYQDQPKAGAECSQCLEFLPGTPDQSTGGCKVIPGDDQIAAKGWCSAWNTL